MSDGSGAGGGGGAGFLGAGFLTSALGGGFGGRLFGRGIGVCRRRGQIGGHGERGDRFFGGCAGCRRGFRRSGYAAGGHGGFLGSVVADFFQFGKVALQLLRPGVLGGSLFFLCQLFFCLGGDSALRERQLVGRGGCGAAVLYLGLHLARGAAFGGTDLCLGRAFGQLAPVGVEVSALGGNDLPGFLGRSAVRLLGIGHVQDGPGLDAVDVAANEGRGVAVQHGNQHLVKGDASDGMGCGDAPGGVPGADGDVTGGRCGCSGRCRGRDGRLHPWLGAVAAACLCRGLACAATVGAGAAAAGGGSSSRV